MQHHFFVVFRSFSEFGRCVLQNCIFQFLSDFFVTIGIICFINSLSYKAQQIDIFAQRNFSFVPFPSTGPTNAWQVIRTNQGMHYFLKNLEPVCISTHPTDCVYSIYLKWQNGRQCVLEK